MSRHLAFFFVLGLSVSAYGVEQPNILVIMVDDLGKEWIGAYGAEEIETPHIDALAAGGMVFENAYSMPQCTPTRATLLTGQYPFRHGWVNHWDVPRWGEGCHFDPTHNMTFARILRDAGYATAAAGKWQINDFRIQPSILDEHGFDDWCMWTGFETGVEASAERYWDPYVHTTAGSMTHEGRFGMDVFVEFLQEFMREHSTEPMLLYFPMALTHTPFVGTPDEPEVTSQYDRHRAMVRYMDAAVGKLVKTLDDLEIREKTIVVFTTDNGTVGGITGRLNGREVRGGKAKLREPGPNLPFIVNGPGIVPSGVVTDALTDFSDWLPTFAELAGADIPEGLELDGKSFAKVITGEARDSSREWMLAMGFGPAMLNDVGRVTPKVRYANRIVRDKRYKVWVEDGEVSRLYDLESDPGELVNIIDTEDAAALAALARLRAVVESLPKVDGAPRYDPVWPE